MRRAAECAGLMLALVLVTAGIAEADTGKVPRIRVLADEVIQ